MSKSKKDIGNLFTKEDEDWLEEMVKIRMVNDMLKNNLFEVN
jgi:hypothetical protein